MLNFGSRHQVPERIDEFNKNKAKRLSNVAHSCEWSNAKLSAPHM